MPLTVVKIPGKNYDLRIEFEGENWTISPTESPPGGETPVESFKETFMDPALLELEGWIRNHVGFGEDAHLNLVVLRRFYASYQDLKESGRL